MDVLQTTEITNDDDNTATLAIVEDRAHGTVSIRTTLTDSDGQPGWTEDGVDLDDAMLDLVIKTLSEIRARRNPSPRSVITINSNVAATTTQALNGLEKAWA